MLLTGDFYNTLRYRIIPPAFVFFFTSSVQLLALFGQDKPISLSTVVENSFGNYFTWKLVSVYICWAIFWLKLPAKHSYGPVTFYGYTPTYLDNGLPYYIGCMVMVLACQLICPELHVEIFYNTPQILGTLNVIAFTLCIFLYLKGKLSPDLSKENSDFPQVYLFYRGIDLHPRFWGIDIKQLTNSRFGVMSWQVLVACYFFAGYNINGFSLAAFTNFFIQSVYLCLFFVYESWYFTTLDITLDRAGYYLCWGCLVWVPCFYTYSAYYAVLHVPVISWQCAAWILVGGVAAVLLKTRVDLEKTWLREAGKDECLLWGRPAKFIKAEYKDATGQPKTTKLLISGSWGIARHFNYTLELLSTLLWTLPCSIGWGLPPSLYFIFLFILLTHRIFRDEEKCSNKYGPYWRQYCAKVPYRLVPYIF